MALNDQRVQRQILEGCSPRSHECTHQQVGMPQRFLYPGAEQQPAPAVHRAKGIWTARLTSTYLANVVVHKSKDVQKWLPHLDKIHERELNDIIEAPYASFECRTLQPFGLPGLGQEELQQMQKFDITMFSYNVLSLGSNKCSCTEPVLSAYLSEQVAAPYHPLSPETRKGIPHDRLADA